MIPQTVPLSNFLEREGMTLDVRTPAEYSHSHLPGALNLPLFNNEERALVGTCYKEKGHYPAVDLGLEIVGPKVADLVKKARHLVGDAPLAKVHCWRGGMRSKSVAALLQACGIDTIVLEGGYKTFRKWCLDTIEKPRNLVIVSGMTGSGKTEILHALKRGGEQIIDLEGLAVHRGSTYGEVPDAEQPSNEALENSIACEWIQTDPSRPVWIEDESRLIGKCKLPAALFHQMTTAPLFIVERPLEERLHILDRDYSNLDNSYLLASTERISRRLGSERTKAIKEDILAGNYRQAGLAALDYYDKAYKHSIERRSQPRFTISAEQLDADGWATRLLEALVDAFATAP